MGKGFRSVLKSACLGLALGGMFFLVPDPANAQLACYDAAVETSTTLTTGAVNTQGEEIVAELDSDRDLTIAALTSALATGFAKLDMDINALGGTVTNNSTMQTSVAAKGIDAGQSQQNVAIQQSAQAAAHNENATGNQAYERNNLCQQATLSGGRSSMAGAMLTQLSGHNPYLAGSKSLTLTPATSAYSNSSSTGSNSTACTTGCGGPNGPPDVLSYEFTQQTMTKKLMDMATAAKPYLDSNQGGTGSDQTLYHRDVDPIGLAIQPTYSDTDMTAHQRLANYLVGIPDDVPSKNAFSTNPAQAAGAILAFNDKIAFRNLSSAALASEESYHAAVTSGAANSVKQIFEAANKADPTWNGAISPYAVDQAMYLEPADDPNFANNFASQNNKTLLEFVGVEMTLLNAIEYRRYLQELEMYKVQSASLNLQVRNFDFGAHP